MEIFKAFSHINVIFTITLIFTVITVNGQISTPCTSQMISTFTPCLNYLTGSTANGGSPTAACCGSLTSLMSSGMDCACLIVTGNVPFSLPINRTLAISLPKACKSTGVPVQCDASAVPLPAPGPALFGPPPPPSTAVLAPASPPAESTADTKPDGIAPTSTEDPTATQGSRPVLNPTLSASTPSYTSSPLILLLAFVGTMILFNH